MRFFLCTVIVSVVAACGSSDAPPDASAPTDATVDAVKDTGKDNSAPPGDTGADAGIDSGDDAEVDADIDTGIDAGVDSGSGSDGGGCTSNADCVGTYYCEKGDGNCSGTGTCTLRPTICTSIYNPVCGCDKTTHANPCESHAAGATVFYKGLCE